MTNKPEPAVPRRSVAMQVAEELMAQNMLDVPCVTVLPVIEHVLAAAPRAAGTRKVLDNFVERELIDVDTADKLEKALEPRAAGGQRLTVDLVREIDDIADALFLTNAIRGRQLKKCVGRLNAALAAAEPQVEGGGKT